MSPGCQGLTRTQSRARAPRPPIAGRTPAARATPRGATRAMPGMTPGRPMLTISMGGAGRRAGGIDPPLTPSRPARAGQLGVGTRVGSGCLAVWGAEAGDPLSGLQGGGPPRQRCPGRPPFDPPAMFGRPGVGPQAGGGRANFNSRIFTAPIKKDSSYAISFLYELILKNSIV